MRSNKTQLATGGMVTSGPDSAGFLPRHLGRSTLAILSIGMLLFVGCRFLETNERLDQIRVFDGELLSPDVIMLNVDSCNGDPEIELLQQTDGNVQISVFTSSAYGSNEDCRDTVEMRLQQPWAGRGIIDGHTGKSIEIFHVVKIVEAEQLSVDRLRLLVDSCRRNAEVSYVRETDTDVQFKVVDSADPFGFSGECQEFRDVQLKEPLGDRVLVDIGTGKPVAVKGGVSVMKAELRYPDTLALYVASCNGDPEVSSLRETKVNVEVRVIAPSTRFGGPYDCDHIIEVQLQQPLGDRIVIDKHTGQRVNVTQN